MTNYRLASMVLLIMTAFLPGAYATIVESGQSVTYAGPEPKPLAYVNDTEERYLYDWAAEVGGVTIETGTDRIFTFTAPTVTPEEGTKGVTVSLLVTDGFGCVNETTTTFTVYAPPGCGISGPGGVCEDSPTKVFSYSGEDTDSSSADFEFAWTIGEISLGTTESIEIDWSSSDFGFDFGDYVLSLTVTKSYSDEAEFTETCVHNVKYVESPDASFTLVSVE